VILVTARPVTGGPPLPQSAALSNHAHQDGAMRKRVARCVLCIGSDFVGLNLRCTLFNNQGWETVNSGNGHEGIFQFNQGGIDLIVLDLDTDGAEAALIVGELKRLDPRVPIIMLIGNRESLVPDASAQADAVVLQSEEGTVLPGCVRRLLKRA
jgi:DNA-binding response OmpR family regulator